MADEESMTITMGEDGSLTIPDNFWDDVPETGTDAEVEAKEPKEADEPTEPVTPQEPEDKTQEPAVEPTEPAKQAEPKKPEDQAFYTPEQMAEAFAAGKVDEAKLTPEVKDYYSRITDVMQQRQQALRTQEELMRKVQQQQAPQAQAQQGHITWEQYMEASKVLAAKNYLKIDVDDFDEFDPRHASARQMAMLEIRDQAQAIRTQQEQQQQRVAGVVGVYAQYQAKVPEFDTISETFFPAWRERLSVRDSKAVDMILASGDPAKLGALLDRVVSDYGASKGKQPVTDAKTDVQKKPTGKPPEVMTAAGGAQEEGKGVVSLKNFGTMSPEEQAEFLINNKFVS